MTTPTCISCGSKFSHNNASEACNVCGLPDEIAAMGQTVVDRWKKQNHVGRTLRLKRRAEADKSKIVFGGSAGRKKNPHGRRGVKRA